LAVNLTDKQTQKEHSIASKKSSSAPKVDAEFARIPRPTHLPSDEELLNASVVAAGKRLASSQEEIVQLVNIIINRYDHWTQEEQEKEEAELDERSKAWLKLIFYEMDPTMLTQLKKLRPSAFNSDGTLKHE